MIPPLGGVTVTQTLVSRTCALAWAVLVLLAATVPAGAQGLAVVVHTNTEQVPLTAYAEMRGSGMLGLSSGSLRDIPCTAPTFRPLVGTEPCRACHSYRKRSHTASARPRASRLSSNGISDTAAATSYFSDRRSPDPFR